MNKPNTAWLLLLFVSALTLGCQEQTAPLLLEPIEAQQIGYAPAQWVNTLDIQYPNQLESVEILGDKIVTVETPQNLVSTISVNDGRILWSQLIGEQHDRLFAPRLSGKELLVCSETQVHTLSALTGKLVDKSSFQRVVNTAPLVYGQTAIFGTVENRVYAHNLMAGFARWEYMMAQRIVVPPIQVGGQAILVVDDSGVYSLITINTGKRIWHGQTFGRITVNPVIGSRQIYIACEDNALYAIDRTTGADRWKFRDTRPLTLQHKLIDNMLIVPLQSKQTVALDPINGSEIWRIKFDGEPVMKVGRNIMFYNKNSIVLFDAESGKLVQKVNAGPLKTVLVGPGKSLILVSPNGRIMRSDPASVIQ